MSWNPYRTPYWYAPLTERPSQYMIDRMIADGITDRKARDEARAERDASIQELSDLRTKYAVEVHGLRDKADVLSYDYNTVCRELKAATELNSRLINTNNALTAANAELTKERDELKTKLAGVEKFAGQRIDDLQNQVQRLCDHNAELRSNPPVITRIPPLTVLKVRVEKTELLEISGNNLNIVVSGGAS